MKPLIICFVICLFPAYLTEEHPNQLIIWNVGQGQWTTLASENSCIHIDMGGEKMNWSQLRNFCGNKKNFALFSHWDWDHIGLTSRAKKQFKHLCLVTKPQGPASERKKRHLAKLPLCQNDKQLEQKYLKEIKWWKASYKAPKRHKNNFPSRVFLIWNGLAPGDGTKKSERHYVPHLSAADKMKIRWLLVPHHGSKTSSSKKLVEALPRLSMVFVSSRKRRYGHPHPLVLKRYRRRNLLPISTEVWGTIRIYF